MGNHQVLTVDQLPDEGNPTGVWYVDAGLGDAWTSVLTAHRRWQAIQT